MDQVWVWREDKASLPRWGARIGVDSAENDRFIASEIPGYGPWNKVLREDDWCVKDSKHQWTNEDNQSILCRRWGWVDRYR